MSSKTTLEHLCQHVSVFGQKRCHFRPPNRLKSVKNASSSVNCGMWVSYGNYHIKITSSHQLLGSFLKIFTYFSSSKLGIKCQTICGTKMSTFGLQNEAFLTLKSVPKSTQKSDLEKRGKKRKRRTRMIDSARPRGQVSGGGGRPKSTDLFRI